MSFILEYMKHPRSVGAIASSSRHLAKKMIKSISFEKCSVIVEYGPGTGAFTDEVVKCRNKDTVFIVIEKNDKFFHTLMKKYSSLENVFIYNDDAGNVNKILSKHGFKCADYIISGLPFSSLPDTVSRHIMEQTRMALSTNGEFITFQYTLFKRHFFEKYMNIVKVDSVLMNLPPAYVLHMTHR